MNNPFNDNAPIGLGLSNGVIGLGLRNGVIGLGLRNGVIGLGLRNGVIGLGLRNGVIGDSFDVLSECVDNMLLMGTMMVHWDELSDGLRDSIVLCIYEAIPD